MDFQNDQHLAFVSLHIYFDDDGAGLDVVKYVPGGDGDCWRADDLLPLVLPAVQLVLADQVGGARHVPVLGLQVGVELLALLVTDGVVQYLHLPFVRHLVAQRDQSQVVKHR